VSRNGQPIWIDPGDRVWHKPTQRWAWAQDTYGEVLCIVHAPTREDPNPKEITVPYDDVEVKGRTAR
jgi:hypothetical protein